MADRIWIVVIRDRRSDTSVTVHRVPAPTRRSRRRKRCTTSTTCTSRSSGKSAVRELAGRGRHSLFEKMLTKVVDALAGIALGEPIATVIASVRAERDEATSYMPPSLATQVRSGAIHYGDPPNTECCAAGPTMNCWDLRVIEFWARGFSLRAIREPENKSPTMLAGEYLDWARVPELEKELPDATDPERLERV